MLCFRLFRTNARNTNVSTHERLLIATAILLIGMSAATAQETYATLIESESTATMEATPTAVIFHLSRSFTGDSLADTVQTAQALAPDLRAALKEAGYERATMNVTGPMIPSTEHKSIRIDAEIRLSLGSTSAEGTRSTAFATAVDKISKIATDLDCAVDGPALDVGDRLEMENKAVQRAIENAYVRAQAAATVMRLEIVSVDHVTIESVTWHDRPGQSKHEASADRIGVTVEIRIAYLALPSGS